jgi:integrase
MATTIGSMIGKAGLSGAGAGDPVAQRCPETGGGASGSVAKVLLTDRYLKGLKPAPAGKRVTIWDAITPNFGVRISDRADLAGKATGVSFVVMRRLPGAKDPSRVTLGRYPALPLGKAREAARKALGEIAGGIAPAEEKRRRQREEAERRAATVDAMAADFIADMQRRGLRNAPEFEAIIRREYLGQEFRNGEWQNGKDHGWRGRPLAEITPQDAARLIRDITSRGGGPEPSHRRRKSGGPWAAHHALAIGKTMWNWALDQHLFPITASPFERIKPKRLIGAKKPRQRILDDAELRFVWQAAEKIGEPYGVLIRLLILTGQRLSQAATMQRPEVDLGKTLWVSPADKMKMGEPHTTPLAPGAVELLQKLLDAPHHRNAYVFSTTLGERPFSGFSKSKARLDALVEEIRRDEAEKIGVEIEPMASWVLHDVRRTVRSNLPALGVSEVVAEAILAHARPGISGVYDRYSYLPEKRSALERWAARVAAIVTPPPGNVVPLRRTAE